MARVLTSHRCGPGSIPRAARGPCGLSLLLVLVLAPRVFLRFSHAKFQIGLDARMPSKRVLELLGITRINKITLLCSVASHEKRAREHAILLASLSKRAERSEREVWAESSRKKTIWRKNLSTRQYFDTTSISPLEKVEIVFLHVMPYKK